MRIAAGASGPCPAICSAICSANRRGMLLDLYVQKARARPVSVHSLCIAAMVPPTTALRWIYKLLACGLVERRRCERDLRVVHIELTGRGMTAIEAHFASTQAS